MRLFVATALPQDARQILSRRRGEIRGVSWVNPDSFHLTYAFLGEQEDSVVKRLDPGLRETLAGTHSFDATTGRRGVFPPHRKPRVGWLALEPENEFSLIAQKVRAALTALEISFDTKPFHPHLTMFRVRSAPAGRSEELGRYLRGEADDPVKFEVNEVTLYSSTLHASGAVHRAEAVVRLA